jgi:vWA-MoxR associated protein C-terminal domain/Caspase domain/vWA-MoxR associated protein middle region (VMAP-M) 1
MKNLSANNFGRYLIAIGSPYCQKIGLNTLINVENDINRISEIFIEQGYERVLTDQIELGDTSTNIKKALSDWFSSPERQVSDCVIVYYAGHGDECGDYGTHYLFTIESSMTKLTTSAIETSSLAKLFFEGSLNTPANILVILDVCYAGAGTRDISSIFNQRKEVFPQGSGFWVISSANANTEAGDGAFVDALAAVMSPDSELFQGSQDFVAIDSLVKAINSYLEANQLPQNVTFNCAEGSGQAIFIRNSRNSLSEILPDYRNLVSTLKQINPELLNTAYRKTYPEYLESTYPRGIEDKLNILIKSPQGFERNLPQFIAFLIHQNDIALNIREALNGWSFSNLTDFKKFLNSFKKSYAKKPEFYLMLQVDEHKQEPGKFTIKAKLVEDPDSSDKQAEWLSTTLAVAEDENPKLDLNDIPEVIFSLVEECVCNKCIALSELTIHCFFPIRLLHQEIDQKVKIPRGEDLLCLGAECKVVVRSLERQKQNGGFRFKHPDWKKQWDELIKCQQSYCKDIFLLSEDKIHDFYTDEELLDPAKIGCAFVGKHEDSEEHKKLFGKILGTAQPIALWLRPNYVIEEPYAAISSVLDCTIEELPARLTRMRLTQDESVRSAALLWDNPYRPFPEDDWKGRSE